MKAIERVLLTIAVTGAAAAAIAIALRSRTASAGERPPSTTRRPLLDLAPDGDPDAFMATAGPAVLRFPASSWERARAAGLGFQETIDRVDPHAWTMLADAAEALDLDEIYLTSLYRPGDDGPHAKGRAIDVGYIRQHGHALVLLRRNGGAPEIEPPLAAAFREELVRAGATQVLTPWWIFSKGTRNDPNTGAEGIDADHLSHLHVTLPPA